VVRQSREAAHLTKARSHRGHAQRGDTCGSAKDERSSEKQHVEGIKVVVGRSKDVVGRSKDDFVRLWRTDFVRCFGAFVLT